MLCNIRDVRVAHCFERLLRVFYAFRKSISRLVSTKHFVNTERAVIELALMSVILGRELWTPLHPSHKAGVHWCSPSSTSYQYLPVRVLYTDLSHIIGVAWRMKIHHLDTPDDRRIKIVSARTGTRKSAIHWFFAHYRGCLENKNTSLGHTRG
jgi:hypothetical protein